MAEPAATQPLDPPRVYLVHMVVFTMLVGVLVAVIYPGLKSAFEANPLLNGVIIATLVLGMLHTYRMVGRLFREVNWVNRFREGDTSDNHRPPQLLAPMALLLKNRRIPCSRPCRCAPCWIRSPRASTSRATCRAISSGLLIFLDCSAPSGACSRR